MLLPIRKRPRSQLKSTRILFSPFLAFVNAFWLTDWTICVDRFPLQTVIFQIEYEIDEIQLSYLQLLSNQAQQMFTFKCKNSVAWYDENSRSFKKAVKFEGASGHEFSSKSKSKKAMIKVPHDGCKVILLIHSCFFFSRILVDNVSFKNVSLWDMRELKSLRLRRARN